MLNSMKLFRRSNGYWYIRFERGKERSLRTKDRRLAERLFREIQKEALKGRLVILEKQEKISLSEFTKEYLAWAEAHKASSTTKRDAWALNHFLEFVGDRPLRSISAKLVEDYRTFLLQRGRKPSSVNVEYRHLKAAFNKAKDWGYLKENPFARLKPLKEPKSPPKFLSREEVGRLLAYLKENDPDFHDLVLFGLETGARRIEILRLRWEDVDWRRKRIRLHGKGDKDREIPMTSSIEDLLRARGPKPCGRVFPYTHHDTITHKWKKTMRKLGMNYRFHDLRHTTASWLVMNGAPLKVVQELLGHTDIRVTQIYAHLSRDYLREVLEATFAGKTQAPTCEVFEFQRK